MPISEYLLNLRAKIGHDMLFLPGVTAVILNEAGELLLQQRSDDAEWSLISGVMDPDEEPAEAIVREVWEEAALKVLPERVVGLYTGPEFLSHYDNGDVVLYLDIAFACRPLSGEPRVNDDESLAIRYFPLHALPPMRQIHHTRLADALRNDPRVLFQFNGLPQLETGGQRLMPMSEYIRDLRLKIGTDLLFTPGVTAVVINAVGEILLHRRSDNGRWWLPGGAVDPGEEPADAVAREVWAETGVRVVPERVVGVYGGPEGFGRYPNGDQIAMVSIAFLCRPVGGEPRVNDEESLEVRYFTPGALPELDSRHRARIELALRADVRADFKFAPSPGGKE